MDSEVHKKNKKIDKQAKNQKGWTDSTMFNPSLGYFHHHIMY